MKPFTGFLIFGISLAGFFFLPSISVAEEKEPFFFIQLSDPQFGMFTGNKGFEQETANFEFAVATVNRLQPAFVVITGDLVHKPGDEEQIAEYLRIVEKIDSAIPTYSLVGNHDIGNVPTPQTIAAYSEIYGPDYFTFKHGDFVGIALNSMLIHSPEHTTKQLEEQKRWLKRELERARDAEARHIVIFQHHPWFLRTVDEPDAYMNIPRERREEYLELFREFGVKYLFSGHLHNNAIAHADGIEAITTGPVGKPLGTGKSGLRVAIVRENSIEHRYYHFGEIPTRIELED
jgi:serine/threonine-protein phosphatase CPPED1